MKIVKDFPPNYQKILAVFPAIKDRQVVFAWDDTLYCPLGGVIPDHLMVHEETHRAQQHGRPELWWDKYLHDSSFRLQEEVEAYQRQYKFEKIRIGRERSRSFLQELARDLSSPIYGNIIGFDLAKEAIKYGTTN